MATLFTSRNGVSSNGPKYLTSAWSNAVDAQYGRIRPFPDVDAVIQANPDLKAEDDLACTVFQRKRDENNRAYPHRHRNTDEYQAWSAAAAENEREHDAEHDAVKAKARELPQARSWIDDYADAKNTELGEGWGDVVRGVFDIEGRGSYSHEKIQIVEMFPCRPTDLDALARHNSWCSTYVTLKKQATTNGLFTKIRALVADPVEDAKFAYVSSAEFKAFVDSVKNAFAESDGGKYQAKYEEYRAKANDATTSAEVTRFRTIRDLYSEVRSPARRVVFLEKFGLPAIEDDERFGFVVNQVAQFSDSGYITGDYETGAILLHLLTRGYTLEQVEAVAIEVDKAPSIDRGRDFFASRNYDRINSIVTEVAGERATAAAAASGASAE